MKVEWIKIKNYTGYLIFNSGFVLSLKNKKYPRILTMQPNNKNYLRVELWEKNKGHKIKIASLVAYHFIGPRPYGLEIDHIDGIKSHNDYRNLEYVTKSENMKRAFKLGLLKIPLPPINAKLTIKQVKAIRYLLLHTDFTLKTIGNLFNVTKMAIWFIKHNINWRNV